jgi:hypothetical protein
MQEHKSLEEWMTNNPESSWLVLQGAVEPIGPVIRGFNDRSIKGVVQRLNIKEFVTSRNTSGFWYVYSYNVFLVYCILYYKDNSI